MRIKWTEAFTAIDCASHSEGCISMLLTYKYDCYCFKVVDGNFLV
jgi:hypothetical protein